MSKFIGLDSFTGLPDNWDSIPAGTLDRGGHVPYTDDGRIVFIKGWFNDTSHILLSHCREIDPSNLIIHFDADVYSSTLFALTEIDSLKKNYIAIFDEFSGHECRALYNYIQSHNAKVTFLGKTLFDHYPRCALLRIEPHKPIGNNANVIGILEHK
jgi:hypothetical protein